MYRNMYYICKMHWNQYICVIYYWLRGIAIKHILSPGIKITSRFVNNHTTIIQVLYKAFICSVYFGPALWPIYVTDSFEGNTNQTQMTEIPGISLQILLEGAAMSFWFMNQTNIYLFLEFILQNVDFIIYWSTTHEVFFIFAKSFLI